MQQTTKPFIVIDFDQRQILLDHLKKHHNLGDTQYETVQKCLIQNYKIEYGMVEAGSISNRILIGGEENLTFFALLLSK